ncbi:MAG: hypothetical protein H6704_19775 [Myxococcales bacterium]|nr:hypothetical protein [Myxococcales bacterium]
MLTALALIHVLAAPAAPPCPATSTHHGAAKTWAEATATAFDWPDRRLDWKALPARFPVAEQRTLLHGATQRVDLVRGHDQVAVVSGRKVADDTWCVAGTYTWYFGGRGVTVRTAQAETASADVVVLLDLEGRFSSPDDAFERTLVLLRAGADGRIARVTTPTLDLGYAERTALVRSAGGRVRLTVRRAPPTDVYAVGDDLDPRRLYRLPGEGAGGAAAKARLAKVCAGARPFAPPDVPAKRLAKAPEVFVGTLQRVGELTFPTEADEGAVVELWFSDVEVERDELGDPAPAAPRRVVMPTPAPLAEELAALSSPPRPALPSACLGKLGLPAPLEVGRRYRVYAAAVWEGEQRALGLAPITPPR